MNHQSFAQFAASMRECHSDLYDTVSAVAASCLQTFDFSLDALNDYLAIVEDDHIIVFAFPWGETWRACNSTMQDMHVTGGWMADTCFETREEALAVALRRAEARRREVLQRGR